MTRTSALSPDQRSELLLIPTPTLASVLSKLNVTNCWIRRVRPLRTQSTQRVVGHAYTLRFTPARSDLSLNLNTRIAIEQMTSGCIAVTDTGGFTDVGVVGDVLCSRMHFLGVQGFIADGSVRDIDGIDNSGLGVWATSVAAPLPSDGLVLVGIQEIVNCGGVTVCPNDILVCDNDGAIVIPHALIALVIEQAKEMERFEQWAMMQVKSGVPLPGLYPPNETAKNQYLTWLSDNS